MKTYTFEQGFAGHFCGADNCKFRRNTVVSNGEHEVVVSTVGNYFPMSHVHGAEGPVTIGHNRYYETYVFEGVPFLDNMYTEVGRKINKFFDLYPLLNVPDSGNDFHANLGHDRMVRRVRYWLRNVSAEDFEKECAA